MRDEHPVRDISTIAALVDVIGKTPGAMHLKVIDHLDMGALSWLSASPLMFAAFGNDTGISLTLGGGRPAFTSGDARELRIPVSWLDDPQLAQPGDAFGSLFLVPGIGETLRINGTVTSVNGDAIRIGVAECYGHCAKALIRSELWAAQPSADTLDDPAAFVAASRFMALATMSAQGAADLSPKGDPAGCMAQLDDGALWFADRPGNRRVDSFRNIIEQPRIAMALLIPGSNQIAIIRGHARITSDVQARAQFAVNGKTPSLAIGVETEEIELRASPALKRATPWPVHGKADIDPARLFIEHIKLNRVGGMGAALARTSLSVPGMTGLIRKGLEKDYKDNLY